MPHLPLPRHGRSLRAGAMAATVVAVVLSFVLGGCQPALTLRNLDARVHASSLDDFRSWWVAEQAALHGVARSTVTTWVRDGSPHLDDRTSRSGRWDLSTDRCSFAPDAGPGFDFRWPCVRHDLAWRNLARLDRQVGGGIDTRARRLRANDRFLTDMEATCRPRSIVERAACFALAAAYAQAVDLAA
jgi:hypothetical protein